MKKIPYLEMVKELLDDEEFLKFQKTYNIPIKKSIKIVKHHGFRNTKSDLYDKVKSMISQQRNLLEPNFSYNGKKYNDVLYVTRKETLPKSSLGSYFLHQAGFIYVQEMAASIPVQVLGINPGDIVLDMCAAPGGKSIQISDKLENGFLISNEIDNGRRKALRSNIQRCGVFNAGVIGEDGCILGDKFPETFDKVLVDVPCSGEGMQYKSEKKVRQRDEKKSKKLSDLQIKLLISGLKSLKVGGELVYSTCTTNVLENEHVISEVIKQYGDKIELLSIPLDEKSDGISYWRGNEILSQENAEKIARFWPHIHQTGGFFIAKFRKIKSFNSSLGTDSFIKDLIKNNINIPTDLILHKLADWGIGNNSELEFFISKYTINVAPKILVNNHFENSISNIEIGLPIFKILNDNKSKSQKLIPLPGLAKVFGNIATKNIIDIDDIQLKSLMGKGDLIGEELKEYEGNYIILKRNGVGVGLVSIQKGMGKNKCF